MGRWPVFRWLAGLPGHPDDPDPESRPWFWVMVTTLAVLAYGVDTGNVAISISVGKANVAAAGRTRAVRPRLLQALSSQWPSQFSTGVPAGTVLTPYTGPCTITADNTTIDSKIVDNCPDGFSVQAANLVINKSRVTTLIRLDTDSSGYTSSGGTWSMTVTDSDISAGPVQQAALCCGNMDVLRSQFHGGQTDIQCEQSKFCRVRDSWLSDIYRTWTQNWHLGAFLSDGTAGASCTGVGSNGLCIELTHNTLWCDAPYNGIADHGCSGDLQLIPNFARIENVKVDNNFFRANPDAAFCTFGGDKSDSTWRYGRNIVYSNNVFERGTSNICAAFGPVTDFGSDSTNNPLNSWANNKYEDGTAIPAP